jgi:peptidoglycan/xylan/chitin deacetylase (PgdA/CDA1 family)
VWLKSHHRRMRMFSRTKIDAWVRKALLGSAALRLAADLRAPAAAILMYHSVLPDPQSQADRLGDISHSQESFRAQMELLSRDYHPISLDDAIRKLRADEDLPKRAVIVTFDDGYADNYEVAMPILNEFGIPATFYVIVDCVEKHTLPWPGRLRFAFHKTRAEFWKDASDKSWALGDSPARERAFQAACGVCAKSGAQERNDLVTRIETELGVCLPAESDSLMMTPDRLMSLVDHGHVVGSHTMTHPNMAHVNENEAQWELAESKRRLDSMLGTPIKHFAYPCPALSPPWSEHTVQQTRAGGYESAVTTDDGLMQRGQNLLCLPRIRPTKSVEGLRWNLESALAGRAAK